MVVNKKVEPSHTIFQEMIQGCARQWNSVHNPALNGPGLQRRDIPHTKWSRRVAPSGSMQERIWCCIQDA